MSARPWHRLPDPEIPTWKPMDGFIEAAPNVWVPAGYRPSAYELPTPIVTTPVEAATEYARCANPDGGLAYFALNFGWSLHIDDPSGVPQYRKIPAYPYVLDFFDHAQTVANFHVEKSRQMLLSWLWMVTFLWDILFHDTWANVAFSIQESLVDDGGPNSTPDSLFGKIRVVWQCLPAYLQHQVIFRKLLIQCPATKSYIRGRAPTTGSGRGPAYNRGLVDEAAHVPHSEVLFRALRASVKTGLILNSSPFGKANTFARIRFDHVGTFERLSYAWTMLPTMTDGLSCTCGWAHDPTADELPYEQFGAHVCRPTASGEKAERRARSPRYDTATADYTQAQRASEYDLSYEESQRGRVYDAFDATRLTRDHQAVVGPRRETETPEAYRRRYLEAVLDPKLTTVVGWDLGVSDPTSLCLGQEVDPVTMTIRWIDELEMTDKSWGYYRLFVNGLWAPVVKKVTGMGLLHYCDPSGKSRDSSLMSWVTNLADGSQEAVGRYGQPIVMVTGPKVGSLLDWYDAINELMRRGHFEVLTMCAKVIDMCGQWHFPLDDEGNPVPGEHLPVHNEFSHMGTSQSYVYMFRYHNRLRRTSAPAVMDRGEMFKAGKGDRMAGVKRG